MSMRKAAALVLGLLVLVGTARADIFTWDGGGGGNTNWGTGANWAGVPDNTMPTASDIAAFSGTINRNVMVDAARSIAGLEFSGSAVWQFQSTANALTLSGPINFNNTNTAVNAITMYGALAGSTTLTVNSGFVLFNNTTAAASSFTGNIYVNGGTLSDGQVASLGNSANTVYVGATSGSADASFQVKHHSASDQTHAYNMVIRAGSSGKAILGSGLNIGQGRGIVSGTITLNKEVTFLSTNLQTFSNAWRWNKYGMAKYTGNVTGVGTTNVSKDGIGGVELAGAMSYTGTTTLNEGVLHINNAGNTFTGAINVKSGSLYVGADGSFGNAGNVITLGSASNVASLYSTGTQNTTVTYSRNFALDGNAMIVRAGLKVVPVFNGVFSGDGALIMAHESAVGTGVAGLNSNNIHSGGTIVADGYAGPTVDTAITSYGSGTLRVLNDGFATVRNAANITGSALIEKGGNIVIYNDAIPAIAATSSGRIMLVGSSSTNINTALADGATVGNGYMTYGAFAAATFTGATLAPNADDVYRFELYRDQTLTMDAGSAATATGAINDSGATVRSLDITTSDGFIQGVNPTMILLTDTNTYSGSTMIRNNAKLKIASQNSPGKSVFGGSTGAVTMSNGILELTAWAAFNSVVEKGDLTLDGNGIIQMTGANAINFTVPNLIRGGQGNRGTMYMTSAGDGLGGAALRMNVTDAADRAVTNGIVNPHMMYISAANAPGFMTYGANGFAPLATGSYLTSLTTGVDGEDDVVSIGATAVPADARVYAIKTNGALTGSNTVKVISGGVALNSPADTIHTASLDFGAAEGIIFSGVANRKEVITGNITGTGGLTKFGPGHLFLGTSTVKPDNTSTLTGDIVVNQGRLGVFSNKSLGNTSKKVILNGGTLLMVQTDNAAGTLVPADERITREIYLGNAGGHIGGADETFNGSSGFGSYPHFYGNITGPGKLYLDIANWGVYIDGTANDYAGGTYIGGMSTVNVAATSRLGTGDVVVGSTGGNYAGPGGNHSSLWLNGNANINSNATLTIRNSASTVYMRSPAPTIGALEGSGMLYLGNAGVSAATLTVGNNGKSTDYFGSIFNTDSLHETNGTELLGKGNLTKVGSGTLTIWGENYYTGNTIVDGGGLVLKAGQWSRDGLYTVNGTVSVPAVLTVDGIITASITADKAVTVNTNGTLNGNGIINRPVVISGGHRGGSGTINGIVTLNSGTFGGSGTINGAFTVVGGNVIDTAAITGALVMNGGTFAGTHSINGPVTLNAGTFGGNNTIVGNVTADAAAINPGNSIGTIGITGNLVMSAGTVLNMELGALETSDLITVAGDVNLGGATVNLFADTGYTVTAGTYTLMTYTGIRTGVFADNVINPDGDLDYDFDYSTAGVITLNVSANSILGDYDGSSVLDIADIEMLVNNFSIRASFNAVYDLTGDSIVDKADLAYWVTQLKGDRMGDSDLSGFVDFLDFQALLNHWTLGGQSWSTGDFTGDLVVDFDDFQILLDNWNPSGMGGSIPEPATLSLLGLGALALLRRNRK